MRSLFHHRLRKLKNGLPPPPVPELASGRLRALLRLARIAKVRNHAPTAVLRHLDQGMADLDAYRATGVVDDAMEARCHAALERCRQVWVAYQRTCQR